MGGKRGSLEKKKVDRSAGEGGGGLGFFKEERRGVTRG